jgi:hypothetical protein
LTVNNEDQFISQTTGSTKIESIYAVAIYDPNDGSVRHMHHVVSMTGSLPKNPETIEKEAISNATRYGHEVANLKVLHVQDLKLRGISAEYRVDTEKKILVKISEGDLNFKDMVRRKKSDK